MDRLTIHQVEALLQEIEKAPPTNIILTQLLRELKGGPAAPPDAPSERDFEAALSNLPNVETVRTDKPAEPVLFSKTGSRIRKIVYKRNGQQVV